MLPYLFPFKVKIIRNESVKKILLETEEKWCTTIILDIKIRNLKRRILLIKKFFYE